jgi:sugar lactone lactonase YvrE
VAEAGRRIGAQLHTAALPATDTAVRAVPGPWAFHGAFPRWCQSSRRLYWADTLAPALRVFDGAADIELSAIDSPIAGLILRADDLVVAHQAGAMRVTAAGLSAPITAWPAGKLQALHAAADDAVWAAFEVPNGSAVGLVQPGGYFDPQWRIDEPIQALCWDPHQQQLYATAPSSGAILVLRPGSAALRRLATIPKGSGRLGGVAVDAAGGVWTALCDGWSVMRISPDGNLDRVIGLPVPCPTDVALGGADGDELFITTARQPVALDTLAKAPLSGRLLVTRI